MIYAYITLILSILFGSSFGQNIESNQFDALNRLKNVNKVNENSITYQNDEVGNRIGMIITGPTTNKIPIANAGADQTVNEGTLVTMDGSASSDPDGNPLTYKWTAPNGITLSSATAAKPTFTAPEVINDSTINFSLVVNDGLVNSTPATVKVTILNVVKLGVSNLDSPFFKIFPNPTTGIVNIELANGTGCITQVLVTSLVGVEIYRKEIANSAKFRIDLSYQVNGIYLLKVIYNNQQYISKIVIKKE